MWQIWLLLSGFFFVLEILTVGFLVFWLAIGALFAMITSFFTDNLIIQTSVFVVSSGLLIFLTKPFVKKFATTKTVQTNAYSVIGKKGIVTKEIQESKIGQIKVGSETWSAKASKEEQTILEGTEVEVVQIDGVKAIVEPILVTSSH